MVFVRRQLGDAYPDLFLSFLAICAELRQKHLSVRFGVLQTVLDLDAISLASFGDQFLPGCQYSCAVFVQVGIDLLAQGIPPRGTLFRLVSLVGGNRTLDIDLFRDAVGGDAGENRCEARLVGSCPTQKKGHAKSFSFHLPKTF